MGNVEDDRSAQQKGIDEAKSWCISHKASYLHSGFVVGLLFICEDCSARVIFDREELWKFVEQMFKGCTNREKETEYWKILGRYRGLRVTHAYSTDAHVCPDCAAKRREK